MYETIYLDSDTPIFRAATFCQKTSIIVEHDLFKEEFKNVSTFHGSSWKRKDGGWLAEYNKNNNLNIKSEDCVITNKVVQVNSIEDGVNQFDFFIGAIKRANVARDYVCGVGGTGNFRYEIAKQLPYKGNRGDKPLLLEEVKEAILNKYKSKIVVVDSVEVDDWTAAKAWDNYLNFRKTGRYRDCIGIYDKDLKQCIGPIYDYGAKKLWIQSPHEAAKHLCKQLILGDYECDGIPKLPCVSKELADQYGVSIARGLGEATTLKFLDQCDDIPSMFSFVVEAYKSCYGVERKVFTCWDGTEVQWNYLDYLQDTFELIWLRRDLNSRSYITDVLDRVGVKYD